MLTPETRTAPPESAVPPSSRPPRVTTGATRPLGSRYAELSPSRRYLLKSGVTVPAPPGSSTYVAICETLVMKALYRIFHDRHVLSISDLDHPYPYGIALPARPVRNGGGPRWRPSPSTPPPCPHRAPPRTAPSPGTRCTWADRPRSTRT